MDAWRKNVGSKCSRRSTKPLPIMSKRTCNKENRVLFKPNRQLYVNSPNSRGSRLPHNEARPDRKSITRRLSFTKHDDSISLVSLEEVDVTNNIPGRQEIPMIRVRDCGGEASSKAARLTSHTSLASCSFMERINALKKEVSEETMEYLRKTGVVKTSPSRTKSFSNYSNLNFMSTTQMGDKSEVQFSITIPNLEEMYLRHWKDRELLRMRYKREMDDLENLQNEEMKEFFSRMKENKIPETVPVPASVPDLVSAPTRVPTPAHVPAPAPVPAPVPDPAAVPAPVPVKVPISKLCSDSFEFQDLSLVQDSFLKTPTSGTWLVSEEVGVMASNSTPNLTLNTILDDMTLNGRQSFMETPATRRLVTRRILQGIESLFL